MIRNDILDSLHGNTIVYAMDTDGQFRWMRWAEARANAAYVALCALCDSPAVKLDHLFPYHQEFNKCKKHLKD